MKIILHYFHVHFLVLVKINLFFFIFIGHYIAFWRKLLADGRCPFFNQGGCFFLSFFFSYYKSCLFFKAQSKAQFLRETFFQFLSLNLCFPVAHDWYVHLVISLLCRVSCYLFPLNDKIQGVKTFIIIFKSLPSKRHRSDIQCIVGVVCQAREQNLPFSMCNLIGYSSCMPLEYSEAALTYIQEDSVSTECIFLGVLRRGRKHCPFCSLLGCASQFH